MIDQVVDDMLRNASKGDRSRMQRVLKYLSMDKLILKTFNDESLYKKFTDYWRTKMDEDAFRYDNPAIPTHLANKCVTDLKRIRATKDKNIK